MTLRNNIIKTVPLLALLFLFIKYPEHIGKLLSTAIIGFAEILVRELIGSLNLIG